MRKLLPVFLLASCGAMAQGFTSSYGGGRYEEGVGVRPAGGGLVTVVRHYSEVAGGYTLQLLRTSMQGIYQATTDVSFPGEVFPQAAVPSLAGNIVVAGSVIRPGRSDQDALLLEVTSAGTVLWSWTSDSPGTEEEFLGLDLQDDGGYVAAGMQRNGADSDGLLARFSSTGAAEWMQHYGGPLNEKLWGVAHDVNGVLAVGRASTYGSKGEAYTLRTDNNGVQQWAYTWGGAGEDEARAVVHRADGSFAWAGLSDNYPVGDTTQYGVRSRHVWLMAVNGDTGDSLWTRAYGDTLRDREGLALQEASNGDLLIAGQREQDSRSQGLVLRTDQTGTLLWERFYAADRRDVVRALLLLTDGGFVAAGKGFGPLGGQTFLVRKNGQGQ